MPVRSLARLILSTALFGLMACGATTPDRPGPPAYLTPSSGNDQSGTVATVLPSPLVVLVTDAQLRPLVGVTVTWAVTAGNGVVTPATTISDAHGSAQTAFSIGPTAGKNAVTASVTGVATPGTFSITGIAGPLAKVTVQDHMLALCKPGDSGNPSGVATDAYGNPVASRVTWISRNPAVASVDSLGNVVLVSAVGSTYIVATAGTVPADSALVRVAPPLVLAAGQVDDALPGATFCVGSDQPGSEFALVAFLSATTFGNSASIVVNSARLGTIGSGANRAPSQLASMAAGLPPLQVVQQNVKFEYALRARERAEMPKYVAGARAWYARMQQQRLSANVAPLARGTAPLAQQIPATAKVGDLVQLNTNANAYCTNPIMATARVAAISNSAIIVSDTSNPSGGFTDAEYQNFAVAMDTLVMPVDTAAFGVPSDIDHNNRVVILFTKAVNALTTDPTQGVVLGFYYSRDLLPLISPTGGPPCPASNVAEMFYLLVPDTGKTVNGGNKYTATKQNVANVVVSTIGHEFQHLINASRRMYVNIGAAPDEEAWLNEGLSHVAEELIFYRASGLGPRQNLGIAELSNPTAHYAFNLYMYGNAGRYQTFLPVTEIHGPIGEFGGDDDLTTRGAIWSFLRYLADTRPTDNTFFYRLVNSYTTGLANMQAVLGADPLPLMRKWATSIYTDGSVPGVDPAYNQLSWNWPLVYSLMGASYKRPVTHVLDSTAPTSLTLKSDGTAFFAFAVSNGQQGLISVTGPGGTALPSGIQLTLVRTR